MKGNVFNILKVLVAAISSVVTMPFCFYVLHWCATDWYEYGFHPIHTAIGTAALFTLYVLPRKLVEYIKELLKN